MAVQFKKVSEGSYVLDCTGYICPQPQLYVKKSLEKMKRGNVLELIFDNPSSAESISAMCEAAGDEIESKGKDARGAMVWRIKKG